MKRLFSAALSALLCMTFLLVPAWAAGEKTLKGTISLPDGKQATRDIEVYLFAYGSVAAEAVVTIPAGAAQADYAMALDASASEVQLTYTAQNSADVLCGPEFYVDANGSVSEESQQQAIPLNGDVTTVDFMLAGGNQTVGGSLVCPGAPHDTALDDIRLYLELNSRDGSDWYSVAYEFKKGDPLTYAVAVQVEEPMEYILSYSVDSRENVYTQGNYYYTTGDEPLGDDGYDQSEPILISQDNAGGPYHLLLSKNALIRGTVRLAEGESIPADHYTALGFTATNTRTGAQYHGDALLNQNEHQRAFSVGVPLEDSADSYVLSYYLYYGGTPRQDVPVSPLRRMGRGGGGYWEEVPANQYYPIGYMYERDIYCAADNSLTLDALDAKTFTFSDGDVTDVDIQLLADDAHYISGFVAAYLGVPAGGLHATVELEDAQTGEPVAQQDVTIPSGETYAPYKFVLPGMGSYVLSYTLKGDTGLYGGGKQYYYGRRQTTVGEERGRAESIVLDGETPIRYNVDLFVDNVYDTRAKARIRVTVPDELLKMPQAPARRAAAALPATEAVSPRPRINVYAPNRALLASEMVTGEPRLNLDIPLCKYVIGYQIGGYVAYYDGQGGITDDFASIAPSRITNDKEVVSLALTLKMGYAPALDGSFTLDHVYLRDAQGAVITQKDTAAKSLELAFAGDVLPRDVLVLCVRSRGGIMQQAMLYELTTADGIQQKTLDMPIAADDTVTVYVWDEELRPLLRAVPLL